MQVNVKMLQKLQEYKWHVIIGASSIIALILVYQVYSSNKKINMLYRCLNELSCRIDDVADMVKKQPRYPQIPQQQQQQHLIQHVSSKPNKVKSTSRKIDVLPPQSPEKPIAQAAPPTPIIGETIIFKVRPQPLRVPSTIEEIDTESDSDVDVENIKMKDVDLDKQLEAELKELDNDNKL